MSRLEDVTSPQQFDAAVSGAAVVHFWAPWCEPCSHMDQVMAALAGSCPPATRFLRVEAEEVDDLAERYDVSAVPHFLVFNGGKVVATVEGADAAALTSAVTSNLGTSDRGLASRAPESSGAAPSGQLLPTPPPKRQDPAASAAAAATATGAAAASPVQGPIVRENGGAAAAPGGDTSALTQRIEALIASAPVMLFMKGSPDAPRCGFSAKVVQALQALGADFGHFDILTDSAVREGLKAYADWPTYPQLWVNKELLGGSDIVLEMAAEGELKEALAAAGAGSGKRGELNDRLQKLVNKAPVMLFIKGSREAPFCRFSKAAVAALNQTGVDFETFDIFQDDKVREGLKTFSNWPTYPQLYRNGELLGGADIIAELAEGGELKDALTS